MRKIRGNFTPKPVIEILESFLNSVKYVLVFIQDKKKKPYQNMFAALRRGILASESQQFLNSWKANFYMMN